MKKMTFKVVVEVPDEVTVGEVAEYIRDEVDCGGGNREPADPLFAKKRTKVFHVSTKT